MRVRSGFVSNSSSSSFVFLGKPVRAAQILDWKKTGDTRRLFAKGKSLGEGIDFFEITEDQALFDEIVSILSTKKDKNPELKHLSFYEISFEKYSDITHRFEANTDDFCDTGPLGQYSEALLKADLTDHLIVVDVDNNSVKDKWSFRARYVPSSDEYKEEHEED